MVNRFISALIATMVLTMVIKCAIIRKTRLTIFSVMVYANHDAETVG